MSKLKSALLGFDARGTLGNAVTFQKRGQGTIVREKPIPAYRRTLPQAYQRWLYEDYAYLWRQQSEATRQEYAAAGSRFHLTGFQYWMKYHLSNLPDIAGWWRLDERSGLVCYDNSHNANHGTRFGAAHVPGTIDYALDFDGINDYVNCTADSALDLTASFSLETFMRADLNAGDYGIFCGVLWKNLAYGIGLRLGEIQAGVFVGGAMLPRANSGVFVVAGTVYHIVMTYDSVNIRLYVDAGTPAVQAKAGPCDSRPADPVLLASQSLIALRYPDCYLDNAIIYSRVLDATEITRHSERGYPA